jgi:hypothetical protein
MHARLGFGILTHLPMAAPVISTGDRAIFPQSKLYFSISMYTTIPAKNSFNYADE